MNPIELFFGVRVRLTISPEKAGFHNSVVRKRNTNEIVIFLFSIIKNCLFRNSEGSVYMRLYNE